MGMFLLSGEEETAAEERAMLARSTPVIIKAKSD
jgi:hypothetical protein